MKSITTLIVAATFAASCPCRSMGQDNESVGQLLQSTLSLPESPITKPMTEEERKLKSIPPAHILEKMLESQAKKGTASKRKEEVLDFPLVNGKRPSVEDIRLAIASDASHRAFSAKLPAVYRRELEVNPRYQIAKHLRRQFPAKGDQLDELFAQRISWRAEDADYLQSVDKHDDGSVDLALAEIANREYRRSIRFGKELANLLGADETDLAVEKVVRLCDVQSLGFAFVAKDLGLDDDSMELARKRYWEYRQSVIDSVIKKNDALSVERTGKNLARLFGVCSRSQLLAYFSYAGFLEEGQDLLAVAERYPKNVRPYIEEAIALADVD